MAAQLRRPLLAWSGCCHHTTLLHTASGWSHHGYSGCALHSSTCACYYVGCMASDRLRRRFAGTAAVCVPTIWLCMQAFYCFRPHDRASFLHTVPALQNMEPTVRSDVCSSLQSALDELEALPPTPGAAQDNYRCLGLRPARHHSAQSYLDPSRLSSKPRHDFAASTLQPLAPGRQRASSSWTFIHRAAIMVRI
jgi:hypothetical protein